MFYNGHNKTFFLGSFDIYNKNQGLTTYGTVPTAAEKQGDFSNFVDTNDNVIPIYDPQTGQAVHGLQRQPAERDLPQPHRPALARRCCSTFPTPTTTGTNYGMDSNIVPASSRFRSRRRPSASRSITSFRRARTLLSRGGETTTTWCRKKALRTARSILPRHRAPATR